MKRSNGREHFHCTGLTILLNLYLAPHCAGQPASGPPSTFSAVSLSASAASTPKASEAPAATHIITVGNAAHKFNPEVTRAEVGDVCNLLPSAPLIYGFSSRVYVQCYKKLIAWNVDTDSVIDYRISVLPTKSQRRAGRLLSTMYPLRDDEGGRVGLLQWVSKCGRRG
jgi:hypothetical protein